MNTQSNQHEFRPFTVPVDASDGRPRYFAVAYIDVLGMRNRMKSLPIDLPRSPIEDSKFVKGLESTTGVILGIVDNLKKYFEMYSRVQVSKELKDSFQHFGLSESYEEFNSVSVRIQTFGDTIVAYAPVSTSNKRSCVEPLYRLTFACGALQIACLQASVVIRGCIDVGWGAELYEGQLHGRILIDAFDIENSVSVYPRIVIGNGYWRFVYDHCRSRRRIWDQFNEEHALHCLDWLCKDTDEYWCVDWLSDNYRKYWESDGAIDRICEFIRKSIAEHGEHGEDAILQKYQRLNEYVKSRMERRSGVT